MNAADIARLRLANQRIACTAFQQPHEVVAWLGAMQAQDYAGAQWAIGLRLIAATEADIERAVADRTIVRTWPMRGTLHFVAAADVRWLLNLLTPRIVAAGARRRQQLELDDAVFAASRDVVVAALQGGRQLTREALYRRLEEARIATANQRGLHILWQLAQEGLLCFGAREGKQQTCVLLDEWTPAGKTMPRDEALAELARRYIAGHGPATAQDLAWWSGLPVAEARAALDSVATELVREVVDGQTYWLAQNGAATRVRDDVYLLPSFDEYLLGYRDRSAVLDHADSTRVVPGNNGIFNPIIVASGRVVGTWKRTLTRRSVALSYSPFALLSDAQTAAVASAAERYGSFLGLPIAAA